MATRGWILFCRIWPSVCCGMPTEMFEQGCHFRRAPTKTLELPVCKHRFAFPTRYNRSDEATHKLLNGEVCTGNRQSIQSRSRLPLYRYLQRSTNLGPMKQASACILFGLSLEMEAYSHFLSGQSFSSMRSTSLQAGLRHLRTINQE
jgi:hypothetical protein